MITIRKDALSKIEKIVIQDNGFINLSWKVNSAGLPLPKDEVEIESLELLKYADLTIGVGIKIEIPAINSRYNEHGFEYDN